MSQSVSQLFRGPFPRSLHHRRCGPAPLRHYTSHFVVCQYDAPLARLRGTGKKIPGEPGHTRDTHGTRGRTSAGTRITPTNPTTIQIHQHTKPARPARGPRTATPIRRRRPKPRPTQQPQARSRPLPAVDSEKAAPSDTRYPSRKHSSCSANFCQQRHESCSQFGRPIGGARMSEALSCARAWHAHHDSIMTHANTHRSITSSLMPGAPPP